MGRAPCCDKANVKRGPWSPEEDATLRTYVQNHGTGGNWIALPRKAGLRRCGKSCRLRWLNYLRSDIKHGGFTEEEDTIICTLYGQMGSRWSAIASQLPGRTDNDVKNYWNTKLKKKIMAGKAMNLKTGTHTRINNTLPSTTLLTHHNVQIQNQSSDFSASQRNHTSSSSTLPILSDANNSGFHINTHNTMISFEPTQLYSPGGFIDVSEINAAGSSMMSLSQEGSSISDSSLIATENKCNVSMADHNNGGGDEATQVLMNFGFGFPSDLVNNGFYNNNQEKMGDEFASSFFPHELLDFGCYADIKPQAGD